MTADTTNAASERLALTCLAHFEKEEAMLAATLDAMRAIRSALIARDLQQLETAVSQQQQTAKTAGDLRASRDEIRQRVAESLGMATEHVSLRHVVKLASPRIADRLESCRRRLSEMANEIERMNRANAMLVRHSIDMLHGFLECLAGAATRSNRYDAGGRIEDGSGGTLFDTKC